jgi:hypothetical protein
MDRALPKILARRRCEPLPLLCAGFCALIWSRWIDYRGIYDATTRAAGFDYFENSRRATYAQRNYAVADPMGWDGYSRHIWGLSACDGPGDLVANFKGEPTQFEGYAADGPKGMPDDWGFPYVVS